MHSPKVSTQRWCCSPAHTSLLFMALAVLCMSHVSARSPVMLADDSKSYSVQCGQCDESRCPVLSYCEGQAIKDSCNCCTVCSSPKYQPHVSVVGGELGLAAPPPSGSGDAPKHECGKVECPKFQVCVANMQGLPLCKCPSEFLCRSNRKRAICGTDGITYESKCHMRIASCKQGMMVRKKHRRACTAADEREGETFKRKMRRRMRRRRRRRQKLEEGTAAEDTVDESTAGGGEIIDGGMGDGEEGLTNFRRDSDVFGNEKRRGKSALQPGETGPQKAKGDKRKEKRAKLKRRRRRKKNRKQRKQRKGSKRDKNERRRRRRKRQNGKPRSRSKRHRYSKKTFDDNAEARERMFEEEFGQSTWYS